jgi:gas vesicle protein
MTASVFAGCNNTKELEEAIDALKDQAIANNQSVADAQSIADKAAKLAEDLKNQLDAANDEINKQKEANQQLQKELEDAKNEIGSIKDQPDPDVIDPGEWEDISKLINESVLAELSQMKVKYLTLRHLWYTEDNYYKLAKLFDDAYSALYRATTADGVTEILTKLADDAAKIPSIASEGEEVQALIKNFGDIDTELFTTHEEAVNKAREDYIAWLKKYSPYFTSVGFIVADYDPEDSAKSTALDGYVMNTFNVATSTLRYAESKLAVLKNYAGKVADDAYAAVKAILTNPTFADIKTKSAAIEDAYELYKIFVVANGGDDSPIQKKDADDKVLLTGEDFVKEYVLVLYDNWLAQYQSQAKAVIDSLPAFFMNNGVAAGEFTGLDTAYLGAYLDAEIKDNYKNYVITYGDLEELDSGDQQLLNEFQRIATLNTAEFLKFTFSGSFKGRLNIEAAYDEVDTAVAKAVAAMADLYYNKIIMPNIEEKVGAFKALATPYSESTDAKYKNFDKAFGTVVVNAVDAYLAELAQFKLPTYAELDNVATPTNGKTNISDLLMFNSEVDANGDVILTLNTNADTSAFIAILKAMKETVTDIADYYADAQVELDHMIDFYNFRKELSINVEKYASDFGKKDGDMVKLADDARGATKLSDNEKDNYNKAVTALGTSARDAIMALDYSTYTATTYQAKNTSNKPLYYQKSDRKLVTESKNNVALTIQVDKLVVAKDAAVDVAKSYLDQIFNTLVDLCRPQVTAYINAAKAAYASYQDDDSLNLTNDINAYVEYLTALPQVSTVARFVNDNFSNKNKKINTETYPTITDLTAEGTNYYLETVGTDQYIVHINGRNYDGDPNVINYAKAKSIIDLDDKNDKSYTYLSTAKFTEVCGMVLHDSDADVTTNGAYGYLDKVRLLAYYKDEVIMDIAKARDDVKGKWNASKGEWTTDPTYNYIYGSSRTARYLKEVDAVYGRIVEKIKAITLPKGLGDKYEETVGKVNAYLSDCFNPQDGKAASKSKDDYSFKVAYDRYYATNQDGSSVYDWSKYNS